MKLVKIVTLCSLSLLLNACDSKENPKKPTQQGEKTMPNTLTHEEITVGTGDSPKVGQKVTVHYVGTLPDGTQFDSSRDRGAPFSFTFGVGQVIQGWDKGLETMKVGGRRKLVIPPHLAYGSQAVGGVIPANATLHFDVELISIH